MKMLSTGKGLGSFFQLLSTATGTAVLVALFAINLQAQKFPSRQITVNPSAADYAAAAGARNVKGPSQARQYSGGAQDECGRSLQFACGTCQPEHCVRLRRAAFSG